MSVFILDETGWNFEFNVQDISEQVVKECLHLESILQEIEVNLTLVHEDEMKEINDEQRQINKVTDVLSFPMMEFKTAGIFLPEEVEMNLNPDTNELMLGDIVICCEKVEAQAKEYNHSTLREFAFLIAHSMFHLMGYDHMEPEEEHLMFQKQEQVLSNLGITRGE